LIEESIALLIVYIWLSSLIEAIKKVLRVEALDLSDGPWVRVGDDVLDV
jgi:hypothetical protein